jgi:hypothetical protein
LGTGTRADSDVAFFGTFEQALNKPISETNASLKFTVEALSDDFDKPDVSDASPLQA